MFPPRKVGILRWLSLERKSFKKTQENLSITNMNFAELTTCHLTLRKGSKEISKQGPVSWLFGVSYIN